MLFEDFKNKLKDLKLFSKGWRSYIYTGHWENRKVAVKVAKGKELTKAIQKEGEILEQLKGIKGFPQILLKGEDFLVYNFIEGVPLGKLKLTVEEEINILKDILKKAYILDSMGIRRDEFQRLDKNVIVDKKGNVYILDFERGGFSSKPSNLTQFLQLLVRKGYIEREEAIYLGKEYKAGRRKEVFFKLLQKLK